MTDLSRPYSKSRVVDADVFASFTEHLHSSLHLLLNGVKVSGVWYLDFMGSLHSGCGPSIMLDDVGNGKPFGLLLSASNTECVGVILSQAAFNWIPVLAPPTTSLPWCFWSAAAQWNLSCSMRPESTHFPLLELSRTGTYEEYPYQEFHRYRARVQLLVLRFIGILHIPVTHQ